MTERVIELDFQEGTDEYRKLRREERTYQELRANAVIRQERLSELTWLLNIDENWPRDWA
jgi:hypothetical protein